ncbi:hypothetical protein ABKN59_011564 [Abortiporus biennis]
MKLDLHRPDSTLDETFASLFYSLVARAKFVKWSDLPRMKSEATRGIGGIQKSFIILSVQFGIRTNFFTFVTLFLTLCPYFLYVGAAPVRDSGGVTANMLMKRKNTLFVVDHATMYELQKRLKELRRFLRLLQVQQTPSDDVALSFLLQDYRQEKNGYHGKDLTLLKSNPIQKRYKRLLEEVTKALKGEFPDLTTFMKKFAARQSTENRERLTAAIQNVAPNVAWQEQVQRFIRPIMMDSFITYTGDRVKVEEQPPAGVSRVSQTPGSSSSSSRGHTNSNANQPNIPSGSRSQYSTGTHSIPSTSHSQPVGSRYAGGGHVNAPIPPPSSASRPNHPNANSAPPPIQYGQTSSTQHQQMMQPLPPSGSSRIPQAPVIPPPPSSFRPTTSASQQSAGSHRSTSHQTSHQYPASPPSVPRTGPGHASQGSGSGYTGYADPTYHGSHSSSQQQQPPVSMDEQRRLQAFQRGQRYSELSSAMEAGLGGSSGHAYSRPNPQRPLTDEERRARAIAKGRGYSELGGALGLKCVVMPPNLLDWEE